MSRFLVPIAEFDHGFLLQFVNIDGEDMVIYKFLVDELLNEITTFVSVSWSHTDMT